MSIVLKSVDFEWPDGQVVFENLSLSLSSNAKYGLIGQNGVGKSTLVRLLLRELEPAKGIIESTSSISYFSQVESSRFSRKTQRRLESDDRRFLSA